MRAPRDVCLICQAVVARRPPRLSRPGPSQWLPVVLFSSSAAFAAAEVPGESTSRDGYIAPPYGQQPLRSTRTAILDNPTATRPSRPPRTPPQQTIQPTKPGSVDFFREIIRTQPSSSAKTSVRGQSGPDQPLTLQAYNDLARLKKMLSDPEVPVVSCYRLYMESIHEQILEARYIPEIFRGEVVYLLERLYAARARDFVSKELPSVAQLTRTSVKLNLINLPSWSGLIQDLVQHVVSESAPDAHATVQGYEASLARRTPLLQDLVEAWRLFSLPRAVINRLDTADDALEGAKFRLPEWNNPDLERYVYRRQLQLGLSVLFPEYPPNQLHGVLPGLAATYVALNDPMVTPPDVRASASPLLAPVARVLTSLKPGEIIKILNPRPDLAQYMTSRWPEVRSMVKGVIRSTPDVAGDPLMVSLDVSGVKRKPTLEIRKELSVALAHRNPELAEMCWLDFVGEEQPPPDYILDIVRGSPRVLQQFMLVFNALRLPNRAVDVWNFGLAIGVKPDSFMYSAMMDGCKHARNLGGLMNVWDKAVASGVQLETGIWVMRISGLMACGKPDLALQALDEMMQRYQTDPTAPQSVKPDSGAVNAALHGLLRLDGMPAARKLLDWAARHNIEPDIATYNTILPYFLKQGSDSTQLLLDEMANRGIHPDNFTIVVLLDGLGAFMEDLGPKQLLAKVKRVLKYLEQIQTSKISKGYAKMIHILLQNPNAGASSSVNAVLAEMVRRRVVFQPHVFTSLVEHYLSRDPPNLAALRDLIQNHRLYDDKTLVDSYFWERVIRGLMRSTAPAEPFEIAMRVLQTTRLSLWVLRDLLEHLVVNGELESAAALVNVVKARHTPPTSDGLDFLQAHKEYWNHAFWEFAAELGLHTRGETPPPQTAGETTTPPQSSAGDLPQQHPARETTPQSPAGERQA